MSRYIIYIIYLIITLEKKGQLYTQQGINHLLVDDANVTYDRQFADNLVTQYHFIAKEVLRDKASRQIRNVMAMIHSKNNPKILGN